MVKRKLVLLSVAFILVALVLGLITSAILPNFLHSPYSRKFYEGLPQSVTFGSETYTFNIEGWNVNSSTGQRSIVCFRVSYSGGGSVLYSVEKGYSTHVFDIEFVVDEVGQDYAVVDVKPLA